MTPSEDLQNSWFNALHERRKNALGVFKDPEYINVFNGVIDKYCDSAHFIYELLQNADDAKATEVKWFLQRINLSLLITVKKDLPCLIQKTLKKIE